MQRLFVAQRRFVYYNIYRPIIPIFFRSLLGWGLGKYSLYFYPRARKALRVYFLLETETLARVMYANLLASRAPKDRDRSLVNWEKRSGGGVKCF
jgi:hypothetical protein